VVPALFVAAVVLATISNILVGALAVAVGCAALPFAYRSYAAHHEEREPNAHLPRWLSGR
jgi:hypothetical protein